MVKNRNAYFDSLKFLLITFVVIGHILEKNRENNLCLALYNVIYLFHMPLFVFISGYFSNKHIDRNKDIRSLLFLFESLLIFQLFHKLPGIINGKETLYSMVANPGWTMWYLYSLIAWRMIIYITPPMLLNKYRLFLCMVTILCLLSGFIPIGSTFSFQRTMVFMPFFFVGYYCGQKRIEFKKFHFSNIFSVLILIFAFLLMLFINRKLDFVLYGSYPYGHNLVSLCLRIIQLIAAVIMSISVISLTKTLPEKYNNIGKCTLFIYLYHTFIIVLLMKMVNMLGIPQSVWIAFVEFCIVCIVLIVILNINILHKLLNPISRMLKRY